MFKRRGSLLLLITGLTLALLVSGCTSRTNGGQPSATEETGQTGDAAQSAPPGTVKLVYVNWAEGIAMTNLAQAILEDKGYKVETTMADVGPVFASLANGSADAFLDTWLPVTHESYMTKYGDKIDDYGVNYEGARIGLVVPQYVTINSIEELNAHADKFKGQIIGIDAGAGIMKATAKAIQDYGLKLKLVEGSEPAMTAALKKAIDNKEWIVVTGWAPHWKFARWDLKFLEDPKKDYGEVENIHITARKGLAEDMPEVADFLKNFKLNAQQLGDLEGRIADGEEPPAAAKAWMAENKDVVDSWWK
ncbi:MAG TPA: glycine betaine ABC transporter substrate-binding protein [Firmicutes bacterium]|nr:glycine betaine ABC transporter substrate-binding protein [Bacillota bacterium]